MPPARKPFLDDEMSVPFYKSHVHPQTVAAGAREPRSSVHAVFSRVRSGAGTTGMMQ